jgi:hypothetical protein
LIFILSPISSRKGSFESSRNCISLDVVIKLRESLSKISSLIIDVFLKMLLHLSDYSSEFLSEYSADERSSHIKSLFTIVISIILSGSSKLSLDEPIGHVSSEKCFLEKVIISNSNMRQ